jgi:hypothetical protein
MHYVFFRCSNPQTKFNLKVDVRPAQKDRVQLHDLSDGQRASRDNIDPNLIYFFEVIEGSPAVTIEVWGLESFDNTPPTSGRPALDPEQEAALAALRAKQYPYGYRLAPEPEAPAVWTNLGDKRIWVKDAAGITNSAGQEVQLGCEVQPLGVYIEVDSTHHYYRGQIEPGSGL